LQNLSNQLHDINPGLGPDVGGGGSNGFGNRVFWTVALPANDAEFNLSKGIAELHVSHLVDQLDYPNYAATVSRDWQTGYGNATLSIDIEWKGPVTRTVDVANADNGFAGHFLENQAAVSWSVRTDSGWDKGFRFVGNPSNKTISNGLVPDSFFAQVGKEQNGIFFASAPASATMQTGTGGAQAVSTVAVPPPPVASGMPAIVSVPVSQPAAPIFAGISSNSAASPPGLTQTTELSSWIGGMSVRKLHHQVLDQVFASLDDSTVWKMF
jgi:hypothetical protein